MYCLSREKRRGLSAMGQRRRSLKRGSAPQACQLPPGFLAAEFYDWLAHDAASGQQDIGKQGR